MQRIVFTILLLPTLAIGAGFDCKMAATRVERLICANTELSSLDDALSEAFSFEVERTEFSARLRATQKVWLANRNGCSDVSCIRQQYEHRIAELSCDPKSAMAGSAIGANQCAYFSRRELDRELSLVEESYIRRVSTEDNNPDYLARTFKDEQSAWRNYRAAYCAHYGAMEGGSDGWKNAFAGMCEVDETKKRIARLKNEIGAK
ncbi:lysozyme inhibitor LprI family protein [Rhodoferax aquaticus]|nr:lysozyme inhibitor LprI family protein [Rhodoferax aquaticus]